MRRDYVLLMGCALLSINSVIAQTRSISGQVTDSRSGTPLAGATVRVKGANTVTVTGNDGSFRLNVPANANTLVISSVGFAEQEVTISGSTVSVSMVASAADLSEVVVTGYTTVARKKYSGAVTTVNPTAVRNQTFGSFDQALQGQAAGVSVIANSGQPGSNAVVRIRGNGSLSGSNVPLYIMDGIEISAADFASVNQGDFERVEILKDAVAASMYGSRGANGVVVISTRKGRAGQLQFNYDAQIGFSDLPKDRLIVMNSSQKIDYELQRGNPYGWTAAEQDSLRKVNFSWKDALFQTGMTQQHQISASGGSSTSRFYASLSYMDQEGVVKTTGLKRYTARINSDNNIKNWRFGVGLQGGYSRVNNTGEANTFLSTPLNAIRWSNPYERDFNPNTGAYQETGGVGTGQLTSGQPNGAMELFLNYNNTNQLKGIGTAYLEFHFPFVKGLYARTNWGVDYTQNEASTFTHPKTSTGIARQGALNRAYGHNFRYTGTTSINYKTVRGKHDLEAGLFTEVVKNRSRNFNFTGYGFTNGIYNEAGITPGSSTNANYIPAVGGGGSENGILSYFTIINYSYDAKYSLQLVGRRDGSSRFGRNNQFANFGSVGLTWSIGDESFLDAAKWVDQLKLRVSYGTVGNQAGSPLGDYPLPLFGRTSYAGVAAYTINTGGNSPGNPDFRWETGRTANLGVDFGFLKNRITGSFEVYDRKTKYLFYSVPIDPTASAINTIPSNFGSLQNRGFEFMLNADVIRTKSFVWSLGGNITLNRNKVLDLPQDSTVSGNTILAEGFPMNSYYMVQYAGVDPANGNSQYVKRDKSLTYAYSTNDRVILGTADAPWYGGLNTSLKYKDFDLSATVSFFLDRVLYNNDRNNVTNPTYYFDNMDVEVLTEWRKPGDVTNVPRPSSGATTLGPANPYQANTTRFLEDASFWRLRNVTLGYNVPASVVNKLKIRAARVFVQGQNWWTKTDYRSFDPEMTGTSLVGAQYPALVQTTFGLSIGF